MSLVPRDEGGRGFKFRIPMRGYEFATLSVRLSRFSFRIPMRGYEISGSAALYVNRSVPNPHEGL